MLGMWQRDWLMIKKSRKLLGFFVVILVLAGWTIPDSSYFVLTSTIFIMVIFRGLVQPTRASGEFDFLLTLPVSRRQYLAEKYGVLTGIVAVTELLLGIILELFVNFGRSSLTQNDIAAALLYGIFLVTFLSALNIPLALRYSVGMTRGIIAIVIAALIVVLGLAHQLTAGASTTALVDYYNHGSIFSKMILVLTTCVAMQTLSFWASYRILSNRGREKNF